MIDAIVRLTVIAVLALAVVNAFQASAIVARLTLHLGRRGGLHLWLPIFTSVADVREWVAGWRSIVLSRDPALVALRLDARLVLSRHLHLALISQTWAIAVTALIPRVV